MDIKKILFKTSSIDVEKALPDALVLCSKEGKIQWVNDAAAEIFETSKMHLLTSKISDFIENPMNLIEKSITEHKPVITKLISREVYFDMTVKEIEEGFVLDFRDSVTNDNNPCCKSDININMNKNNFLIKLANDLKSPLQSIVGFSQAMADGLGGSLSEQQEKYIRIINKNSADLMYFVAKLLELSMTEAGESKPERRVFDLLSLVQSVIKYNEQLFKDKDLKLSIVCENNFNKKISTDEDLIKSIIQNILEVIIKSVDIGEVNVKLSNPDEDYVLSKNVAPGKYVLISLETPSLLFSENDLEFIFDPYKIVNSANRKNVLRAIILSSVKNMVQSIGGIVWVESKILKNTNFNVLIPNYCE